MVLFSWLGTQCKHRAASGFSTVISYLFEMCFRSFSKIESGHLLSSGPWHYLPISLGDHHFRVLRKNTFIVTVVKQWQKLPREAAEALPLEIFKTQLDLILSTAPADPAVSKGLD